MIETVVVGFGLAGRHFHAPLILRQPRLRLRGIVARNADVRAEAATIHQCATYADLDGALADPAVDLVVLATPHDLHAEQTIRTLQAGKHCVVDKVMALSTEDADRMIAARDASARMLSVFHNRRWDWDYQTVRALLAEGAVGRPVVIESSVCLDKPPRTWRARASSGGNLLHDWGAHLIDQALNLGLGCCDRLDAWLAPAPWEGVEPGVGGHARVRLRFGELLYVAEISRMCPIDRPRWWIEGTGGGYTKAGLDPQEAALRAGNLDVAHEPETLHGVLRSAGVERRVPPAPATWDSFYASMAEHLLDHAALAVTAEQAREVVRVLDAAVGSIVTGLTARGPWGWV